MGRFGSTEVAGPVSYHAIPTGSALYMGTHVGISGSSLEQRVLQHRPQGNQVVDGAMVFSCLADSL